MRCWNLPANSAALALCCLTLYLSSVLTHPGYFEHALEKLDKSLCMFRERAVKLDKGVQKGNFWFVELLSSLLGATVKDNLFMPLNLKAEVTLHYWNGRLKPLPWVQGAHVWHMELPVCCEHFPDSSESLHVQKQRNLHKEI